MPRQWLIVVVLAVLQGCYTYAPLETGVPPVGERVELEISDRGRVELAERLGRGVMTIEGRLTAVTNDQFVLNVASVSYLGGETSRWSGESVRLARDQVDHAATRKLSRRRTWVMAAAIVVGVGVFIASRGLIVDFFGGSTDSGNQEPPTSLLPATTP